SVIECQSSSLTTIEPSGFRTAIASARGLRISTPSSTACPPTAHFAAASKPSWTESAKRRVPVMFFSLGDPGSFRKGPFSLGLGGLGLRDVGGRRGLGGLRRLGGLGGLVLGVVLLDAAGGVDELLLPGEEGMAVAADVDRDLLLGRAGVDQVPAGTADLD